MRQFVLRVWRPVVAAGLFTGGMGLMFYGFGLVFLGQTQSPLQAGVGGLAMGAATICGVWAVQLVGWHRRD